MRSDAAAMIVKALALAAAAMLVTAAAHAHSHKFKKLEIVHPWCVETTDVSEPALVSMTIRNGGKPDKLLRATTSIAGNHGPDESRGARPA